MRAKGAAAGGHGGEELTELAREVGGPRLIEFNHLPEQVIGQRAREQSGFLQVLVSKATAQI